MNCLWKQTATDESVRLLPLESTETTANTNKSLCSTEVPLSCSFWICGRNWFSYISAFRAHSHTNTGASHINIHPSVFKYEYRTIFLKRKGSSMSICVMLFMLCQQLLLVALLWRNNEDLSNSTLRTRPFTFSSLFRFKSHEWMASPRIRIRWWLWPWLWSNKRSFHTQILRLHKYLEKRSWIEYIYAATVNIIDKTCDIFAYYWQENNCRNNGDYDRRVHPMSERVNRWNCVKANFGGISLKL